MLGNLHIGGWVALFYCYITVGEFSHAAAGSFFTQTGPSVLTIWIPTDAGDALGTIFNIHKTLIH